MAEMDDEDISDIFEAKFGFQGEGEEGSILVCADWELPHPDDAMQYFCDECGGSIAVDPTSQWFIDNHRSERDQV